MSTSPDQLQIRKARENNLKDVDLDIPHGQLISICGVSGSGKSSLAFDTLYAEGQRRYFECLSTYTRQFLEQLGKPEADRIDGIPPAIALKANRQSVDSSAKYRSTVATASEILPYLALLYSKISDTFCPDCNEQIQPANTNSVFRFVSRLPQGTRFQLLFEQPVNEPVETLQRIRSSGLRRIIADGKTSNVDDLQTNGVSDWIYIVVDRLKVAKDDDSSRRIRESVETTFALGHQQLVLVWEADTNNDVFETIEIDGRKWNLKKFSGNRTCGNCGVTVTRPDASLFNYMTPVGACENCEGFGNTLFVDLDLIVPDKSVSLQDGAIVPWNSPAYEHEKHELLDLSKDYGIDVTIPFFKLPDAAKQLLWDGVPERDFGGLKGFFAWLERRKYKIQIAVFLNRWKSSKPCEVCGGRRFNPAAKAFKIDDLSIADVFELESHQALQHFLNLEVSEAKREIANSVLQRIIERLRYLVQVGLGYLTLSRTVSSLSSGESQRVLLTRILGSTLAGMMYVLDEPSSGLHSHEKPMLLKATRRLLDRGNTVVVVDHDEQMIQSAERVIEIGPGAGADGGSIVFDDSVEALLASDSLTGEFITHRAGLRDPKKPPRKPKGSIKIYGATGNNLKNLDAEIPLRCLCAVSGVSGAGKSTLIERTLYPALCQKKDIAGPNANPFEKVTGDRQIDEVVLVDQSPIGRSSRSNPVTYVKAFDEIRKAFAETIDAKTRNFKPGHFSFNVDGGRCEKCRGEGQLTIDMQFMSDIHVKCDACQGTRFRDEILDIKYRAKNIDDILRMTVREAFTFFRGKTKVQTKLKALIDVGLDYVCLGQSATTLSSGEAQRLKLAHYLNAPKSRRVLFLMDEPTFGLHMRDILKLVDCFDTLIAAGHSLIVIEHNLHLLKHADWIIDLGPGSSNNGGNIVAAGTPKQISQNKESITGKYLNELLAAEATAFSQLPE